MTASSPATVSPSSVRMARKTPWADGCCGPMFIMRRSLPPYPTSMTFRASRSISSSVLASLHRGMRGRAQDDRLHLHQQRVALGQERLPLGILHDLGPDL